MIKNDHFMNALVAANTEFISQPLFFREKNQKKAQKKAQKKKPEKKLKK